MFKYITLILRFKDVAGAYNDEKCQNKPFWLSRTFIGSAIAFIATVLTVFLGIQVSDGQIDILVDSLSTLIPALVAVYGVIMSFVGQVKKTKPADASPVGDTCIEERTEFKPDIAAVEASDNGTVGTGQPSGIDKSF